jgi:nucleoside-diphosphate-sugar epimerase
MSTVLVLGGTGKTGRLLLAQLLAGDHHVRAVVRSRERLDADVAGHPRLTVIEASLLELSDEELSGLVSGCDAVVSCLGHNGNLKGIFGAPRRLCTDAARRVCEAIERNGSSRLIPFILMSTVLVRNDDLGELRGWFDRGVLLALRLVLPPHRDNELAADYLLRTIGKENRRVEWCCVRPGLLIDAEISAYEVAASPVAGILAGRQTSRANVAAFMTELIDNPDTWRAWTCAMPVVLNAEA